MALLVLGPAFLAFKQQGMDPHAAGIATRQLGMGALVIMGVLAGLVIMGVLKFVLSFFGEAVTARCRELRCWVPSPASRWC